MDHISRLINTRLSRNRFLAAATLAFLFALGCSSGPDRTSKLPFGAFDYPIEHASLKGDVKMSGWALSEDGIKEIVVYVDRSFYGFGKMGGPRADVVKVYPAFASTPDIAWTAPLDTTEIPVGSHDVLVRAISNKGAIRDLGNASVNIEH